MSIDTLRTSWQIGDCVTPRPEAGFPAYTTGVTYVIASVPKGARGRNYTARSLTGGQGLRGPADAFLEAPEGSPTDAAPEPVFPGALAHLVVGGKRQVVVVLRVSGETCTATLPGGWGGRHWQKIRLDRLEPIDPARLSIAD